MFFLELCVNNLITLDVVGMEFFNVDSHVCFLPESPLAIWTLEGLAVQVDKVVVLQMTALAERLVTVISGTHKSPIRSFKLSNRVPRENK